MAKDDAYRRAEQKIEEALKTGAKELDLSFSNLSEVPNSLGQLTSLRRLHFNGNSLSRLPDSLGQLTSLEVLDLSRNQLSDLPGSLGQLTSLQRLDLSYNKLGEMPETIAQLTSLQWLFLRCSQLSEVSDSLGELASLKKLDLKSNNLSRVPDSLGQLTSLDELDLSNNQLINVPDSLGQLTSLEALDLGRNQLTEVPESVGQLTSLKKLDLRSNHLSAVPESVGQLTSLRSLSLRSNHLSEVPDSLGRLASLRWLDLRINWVIELPDSLGQLTLLRRLDLGGNYLSAVPSSLGQLTSLEALDLSHNNLSVVPKSLGQLTSLHTLDLSGNNLSIVPESLGQITSLRTLDLGNNQLTELPEFLFEFSELKELFLHGNLALNLPDEILGVTRSEVIQKKASAPSPGAVLDYYSSIRGDYGTELRELKLLIVGRGQAGKTSLVRRLNGDSLDPGEIETHGINISPLTLSCGDGKVTARTWDFGGQHVLHAMHEFFLTARSLYLLVLGEREDMAERDAAYWLQLIRSYAGDAPVVVALNKSKGNARDMDRESLEDNYGPIVAWIPTECEDGYDETIEALRAALTAAADEMPEVRNRFPKKWWQVKEWLEQMDDPYLDFATYQARCAELGEENPKEQEKLAAWLNDLGIAINYADDERLHDTTVLQPEWLANGIYAILRANDSHHKQKYAPDAIISVESLGPIYKGAERLGMLEADEYPEEKWPFLIRLMSLFQLAYPVDDSGETLLVPTLLPSKQAPDSEESKDDDRTRVRYEFAVVPGPLFPKFLVRTFSLIEGAKLWRRGAVLRFGEAIARVWMTEDERWVHITAAGKQEDRDELLTMIRVTLLELFTEYKNLKVVEQWEYKDSWVPRLTLEQFGVLPVENTNSGEVDR